jgi:NAD(P)-dependent dehydrogenase (short-subunit alcohol dehydrogenase family)
MAGLDLTDLNWQRRRYRPWPAYGASKLANLLFTLELQRRLAEDPARSAVRALAAHPGLAGTNLFKTRFPVVERLGRVVINLFGQSAEMGALPQLYAAVADLVSGSYVGPDGRGEATGHPVLVGRSTAARDSALARQLWAMSERLTGVDYPTQRADQTGPAE